MNIDIIIRRIRARLTDTDQKAAAVSRASGLSVDAIRNILNGKSTNPRTDTLLQIAAQLGCSLDYLLGKTDHPDEDGPYKDVARNVIVPVVGFVGAGEEFFFLDDHAQGGGLDEVQAPAGSHPNSVAVIVRGDSMLPVYPRGTIIIYHEHAGNIRERLGKLSIVKCSEGRVMLKTIAKSAKRGCYTLQSFNTDDIDNVKLEWAAPIDWIKPG